MVNIFHINFILRMMGSLSYCASHVCALFGLKNVGLRISDCTSPPCGNVWSCYSFLEWCYLLTTPWQIFNPKILNSWLSWAEVWNFLRVCFFCRCSFQYLSYFQEAWSSLQEVMICWNTTALFPNCLLISHIPFMMGDLVGFI